MEDQSSTPAPVPPSTVRRNPPRRARHTPFVPVSLSRFNPSMSDTVPTITPFSLDDESETLTLIPSPPSKPADSHPIVVSSSCSTNLNVFLRIRPEEIKARPNPSTKTLNLRARSKKSPQKAKKKKSEPCLAVTGPGSVTLTIPKAKLVDSKRGTKNEIYDGFSFVFPPESQQNDVYEKVMDPLVTDFIGGKSSLLVAMGPTGSGKTHTMFGTNRDPGLVPLALRKIFSSNGEESPNQQRSFYLAMVEIYSTSGKGEKMIDLLSAGTELTLVQTTIKGLEEVPVSNLEEADRFLARGMSKRCTASTDANSQSSRSQCIITIRRAQDCFYNGNDSSFGNAVLMIADLAGAERERKTGNLGSRLGESNFINNTSMVFGLCLRSLLEHQKNPKKAFQKHYKDSLLTRYLKDYLEGKKKMTLILTVKRGEEDYMDTSFVLRQASPYMKIKYTNLEEINAPPVPKRSNVSVVQQENKKRRKVGDKGHADSNDTVEILEKGIEEPKSSSSELEKADTNTIPYNELLIDLAKAKQNEEMMTNFAQAFWKCLKQYKLKLSNSEADANRVRETLIQKDKKIIELEEELNKLKLALSYQNLSQNNNISHSEIALLEEELNKVKLALSYQTLSQNNNISHSEIALESEISENLKGFEDYACEVSSTVCDDKRGIDSRDFDDLDSFVITESDLSFKDETETVLCENEISEEKKDENQLEQKLELLTDNETQPTFEHIESTMENENVIQHVEEVHESGSEEFPSSDVDEMKNDSLEETDESDPIISSSSKLQENLQEIEEYTEVKDHQLDAECAMEEMTCNVKLKQEMSSSLDEINQEMSSNSNLENLEEQNNSGSEELEGKITRENEEVNEEIIEEVKEEIIEEVKEEFIEEVKEEIIEVKEEIVEEVKEEIIEEVKEETGIVLTQGENSISVLNLHEALQETEIQEENLEELKETSSENNEIKKEIVNSPVLSDSSKAESSTDNIHDNNQSSSPDTTKSDEKSSIERRNSNRQPIENLIEVIGKENRDASNPAKATKPKRRLLPASSMLLKEFTVPDCDVHIFKEGRGKASAEEKARSEGSMSLIQILTAKPKLKNDRASS